ncbi:MAG: pilus assembly protein TadG-related protein [Vulcanimicrobiaceae bacterium]
MRHHARGQVLPLWIAGSITTLIFAFLALNYGNYIRWQIRAQNAADAAAAAVLAIQAERWNELNETLYATNVEEYRIRTLLNGMLLAANNSGGCTRVRRSTTDFGPYAVGSCPEVFQNLEGAYIQAVNRYTGDATLINDIAASATKSRISADATALLAHIDGPAYCNLPGASTLHPDGGDCAMQYTLEPFTYRSGSTTVGNPSDLGAVVKDARTTYVQSLSSQDYGGGSPPPFAQNAENEALWAPLEAEVDTCAPVPPIIPNFGPIHLATQYAIGRAAATNVMVEQDWLQPGAVFDPDRAGGPTNSPFQPEETYTTDPTASTTGAGSVTGGGYDWYAVNFGGNTTYAYGTVGGKRYDAYVEPFAGNEMSVLTGWWNPISIPPTATAPAPATVCGS